MRRSRSRYLAITLVAAALVVPAMVAPLLATVITAEFFIVAEDETISEDVIVASTSGSVEGVIEGDLTIVTGDLTIFGTVTGSITALSAGTVRIAPGGTVEGSLRTLGPSVEVEGSVAGDALVTAGSFTVHAEGSIGRDVVDFGGAFALHGSVGRDVRGRMFNAGVDGTVGRDLDIAVEVLTIGDTAQIGGDVLYRSANEAAISESADISGEVVDLPAQSNFFYGLVLTLANIITFLGFVVAGLFILWLLRSTGEGAVLAIEQSPLKTFLSGLGVVVVGPVLVLVLAGTLAGIPLAALLLFGLLLGLLFGPIPAVTVFGDLVLRRRAGLFGAFVLGAVIWRAAIWGLSLAGIGAVGAVLFILAVVWGSGGWVIGGWRVRQARSREREALPEGMLVEPDDLPDDFEYPLAPTPSSTLAARAADVMDEAKAEDEEDEDDS